jgi:hypothetical protein
MVSVISIHRYFQMATAIILTLGIVFPVFANDDYDNRSSKKHRFSERVAGTYTIAVDFGDGEAPILALATLNSSGGVVATDTDDFGFQIDQAFHSPKHGTWIRTGKKNVGITLYEFGYLSELGNAPAVVFKLVFDGSFETHKLIEGSGTVSFTAHLLDSSDPLDLDGGTIVAEGSGAFIFRRNEY